MRVMVIVKATKDCEAGKMPGEDIQEAIRNFNAELVKAGVMLACERLHASSFGRRVRFEGGGRKTVLDGPFSEAKEVVGGFWLWQVRSMEEAVEWLKRAPFPAGNEVEIRRVREAEDSGVEFTPDLREQEEQHRAAIDERTKGRATVS